MLGTPVAQAKTTRRIPPRPPLLLLPPKPPLCRAEARPDSAFNLGNDSTVYMGSKRLTKFYIYTNGHGKKVAKSTKVDEP